MPDDPNTDPFRPPSVPVEVFCLHCKQQYESYLIEWRAGTDGHGFWCCPIPGCGGAGFGCDIFPVDPDHRGEGGEPMWCDSEEEFEDEALIDPDESPLNGRTEKGAAPPHEDMKPPY